MNPNPKIEGELTCVAMSTLAAMKEHHGRAYPMEPRATCARGTGGMARGGAREGGRARQLRRMRTRSSARMSSARRSRLGGLCCWARAPVGGQAPALKAHAGSYSLGGGPSIPRLQRSAVPERRPAGGGGQHRIAPAREVVAGQCTPTRPAARARERRRPAKLQDMRQLGLGEEGRGSEGIRAPLRQPFLILYEAAAACGRPIRADGPDQLVLGFAASWAELGR